MKEQADISSTRNGDANLMTKLEQVQIQYNIHKNPDNSIEGKQIRDDNEGTDIVENGNAGIISTTRTTDTDTADSSSSKHNTPDINDYNSGHNHKHTFDPGGVNISKCNFVHDPGRKYFNIKDGVAHDDGDSTSTSTSSDNASCTADTHRSYDRERDKAPFAVPDVKSALEFMHAYRPVPDVTSAILLRDSKCTDAARHPLCPLSPQRLADSLDAFPTDAHCTDALVLPLEASDDDDEDFAQHNRPHRDRRLPARYCTGNFVSSDTPRRAPSHLRPLTADTYRSLDTNNAVLANNRNNNNNSSNINAASIVNAHTINAHTATNSSSSSVHGNTIGTDTNAFNSGSANISPPAPFSTTTRDNEHKHARMPPLEIKPPPVLLTDTTPSTLDLQVMQAIRPSPPISLAPLPTRPTHRLIPHISKTPCLLNT